VGDELGRVNRFRGGDAVDDAGDVYPDDRALMKVVLDRVLDGLQKEAASVTRPRGRADFKQPTIDLLNDVVFLGRVERCGAYKCSRLCLMRKDFEG